MIEKSTSFAVGMILENNDYFTSHSLFAHRILLCSLAVVSVLNFVKMFLYSNRYWFT